MYKKTITYTDYNGVERTEDFYFNFTKAELLEMELGVGGGYGSFLQKIIESKDIPTIAGVFKELILKAYGEKSSDGKKFMKSEELSKEFACTEPYSILYMELATDSKAAADFVNNIIPADMVASINEK